MTPESDEAARSALIALVRESGRDVLATLARVTGDLALAEDAVQDATVRALETWPVDGVPPNPTAWLRLVARRRAIDLIRRDRARSGRELRSVDDPTAEPLLEVGSTDDIEPSALDDDLLRLIFTCCHPSLATTTQVALALRTLCGLTDAEVARALLTTEVAMTKRLVRARQKIRLAGIPYRVPPDHELHARWAAVLTTAYLLFNEGYAASAGADAVRVDLVDTAVRLARLLVRLQPDDVGATGLLALMLLHDARRATRVADDGVALLLADQDRTRWDRDRIEEGVRLVGEGLRRSPGRPDRYVVQAAVAACHLLAPTWEDTDWDAIVSWYDVLLTLDDSPVVQLNRAAAVAQRDGPEAGLRLVDSITGLGGYSWWHASRAELLRRLGRDAEAVEADTRAHALPMSEPARRLLRPES